MTLNRIYSRIRVANKEADIQRFIELYKNFKEKYISNTDDLKELINIYGFESLSKFSRLYNFYIKKKTGL
jgi:hypothetical protein